MFKKFLILEWKAFARSASFGSNLAMKIVMGFVAVYFSIVFLGLGIASFYLIREELHLDPLRTVNRFLIYYFIVDLLIRLLLQKTPVINIKPLLTINLRKNMIVHFALGKTLLSFFNFIHAFFFIPFTIVLLKEGYNPSQVVVWFVAMTFVIYSNNLWNVLLNNKDYLMIIFIGMLIVLGIAQYYDLFDITTYTGVVFDAFFDTSYAFIAQILVFVALYVIAFRYFKSNLYLDTGLSAKQDIAKTEAYTWLDKFGTVGTFLKNDIKLIRRNKRSKMTLFMSVMFLFYGFLFFTNSIELYKGPLWQIFAGIFVSGGFLFTFGQFVPSWDSGYYSLMMTQNIRYRDYLTSKWWLVVIATIISTVLASFYLYFGVKVYAAIVVGAIYNIGVNSHLVLLGGAYIKTPIDLASGKGAFGDKQAFNMKTMLLVLPKLFLPMVFFWIGNLLIGPVAGYAFVAIAGIIGFAFRDKVFSMIEKIYKDEKYKTIAAYKQKN
ncbi:DUF5687 family protein [Flavobacterium kingsejongi]|uniref:Uncharacterized protein n=1 Tax=Flavobacterium kingsejongi TaxID=1678728 RepID=A0A2S1LLE0_9FLAO|nr:DUF5687 family protein [Flavobacterium kingsejongi]AWG24583.1 hypothetical protein FK004_04745 [Flavobacterium kingsejongi]